MDKRGRKEYIQILRLMEVFGEEEVAAAVEDALKLGAISVDAVKYLVLCRMAPPQAQYGELSIPAESR